MIHLQSYIPYFLISVVFGSLVLSSCTLGYNNDGNEVTWHAWSAGYGHYSKKVNADTESFEALKDSYAHDKFHAFYRGDVIDGSDGSSFRVLKHTYAIDNKHAYLAGDIIENADPGSFKVHSRYFAEDKNDYFWGRKALNVRDKETFELLGSDDSWETKWAKDIYNGYYLEGNTIVGIDYDTFHPISSQIPNQSGRYAKDKNRVFFMGKEIPGADPETFKEVDFSVGQDKYRIYIDGIPTQIKEYSNLTKLGRLMYSDGVNIYDSDLKILPDADVSTFEFISHNWYKDKNNVWWNKKLVVGANPTTFSPVTMKSYMGGTYPDFNYGKDDKHVFWQDSIIQGAEATSFEIVEFPDGDSWTVFDRNHVYQGKDSPKLQEYLNKKYGK